jgi:hypothetical protein
MRDQHQVDRADDADRGEVARGIERKRRKQADIGDMVETGEQQRAAIGGAVATARVAGIPAPPARLSITTVSPRRSPSRCPIMRAIMSPLLPAG